MDTNKHQNTPSARYTLKQQEFMKSEAAMLARVELKLMLTDPKYNTQNGYSARSAKEVLFVDKHIQYLCDHPKLDPRHYIMNLKLITKLRN